MRVVTEIAPTLPAAMSVPDVGAEAARAEALDRLCAELDVQIGLTVLKTDAAAIAGTRLRGVAEAAGFRLAAGGRFDWVQEETGSVLYALQNLRTEPFTVDTLRAVRDHGVVLAARRAARRRSGARVRPDEARRQAHGADARRASSSTTTGARSTTPRSRRSASRSTARPRRCAKSTSSRAARARWRCSAA